MRHISKWYILFGEWALKLFILNLLWFIFSLLGLGLLGLFPSTISVYALLRQMIMKPQDIPNIKTFWNTYKQEFIRANLLGYTLVIIGYILYIDLKVLQQLESNILNQSITIIIYILLVIYLLTFLHLFPIYVHFDMRFFDYIKHSFVLVIGKPIQTLIVIVGIGVTILVYIKVPGLIPVFGISVFCFIIMKTASLSFGIEEEI